MKYRNIKTEIDGKVFDSKKEANRYVYLRLMERSGAISELKTQVKYILIPKNKNGREISYIADFTYIENGELIVEDVKSKATKTPLYNLKKRLMAEVHGIKIREFI